MNVKNHKHSHFERSKIETLYYSSNAKIMKTAEPINQHKTPWLVWKQPTPIPFSLDWNLEVFRIFIRKGYDVTLHNECAYRQNNILHSLNAKYIDSSSNGKDYSGRLKRHWESKLNVQVRKQLVIQNVLIEWVNREARACSIFERFSITWFENVCLKTILFYSSHVSETETFKKKLL